MFRVCWKKMSQVANSKQIRICNFTFVNISYNFINNNNKVSNYFIYEKYILNRYQLFGIVQDFKIRIKNILTSKISKPAISSTPMKCCLFCLVSRVSLHFLTSHLNNLSKIPLQRAPTELATWSLLRPWVTNSLPTLMRGFNKFLYRSWQSTPNNLATRSPSWNIIIELGINTVIFNRYMKDNVCMNLGAVGFSLFFTTPLFELHATHVHDAGSDLVDVVLFFLGETEYIESLLYYK